MSESPEIIPAVRQIPDLPDSALKLLGFCRRSGKLVMGAGQVLSQITGRRPPMLVVIAADASERTEKQLYDKCSFRSIKLARASVTGEELARLLGKSGTVMAAGAADAGIAAQMIRLTDEAQGSQE